MDTFWSPPGQVLSFTLCTAQLWSHLPHLTDPKITITAKLWALLAYIWLSTTGPCWSQQVNSLLLYDHKCQDKDSDRRKSRLRIQVTKPPYEILSQQWQLDFNCKFHTEGNVWKHQLFWDQKSPWVFAAQQSGLSTPWLSWALAVSCGHIQGARGPQKNSGQLKGCSNLDQELGSCKHNKSHKM